MRSSKSGGSEGEGRKEAERGKWRASATRSAEKCVRGERVLSGVQLVDLIYVVSLLDEPAGADSPNG